MCIGACNHGWKPFGTLMKMISNTGAVRDEERTEEKEKARREEEEEEEEKKYEKKGEGKGEEEKDDGDGDGDGDGDDEEEKDDDDGDDGDDDDDGDEGDDDGDDDDDDDKGKILKKSKRKPATKIAKQRRKNNRSPVRKSKVTCCFAGLANYSCHTGGLDIQARCRVPEAEKDNFSENDRCCNTCYRHFTYSKVTCCFAGLANYSCHTGGLDTRATNRVPEAEKDKFSENDRCCTTCSRHFTYSNVTCCFAGLPNYSCHTGRLDIRALCRVPEAQKDNFSENDRCCDTCYRHFRDLHAFQNESVCENCEILGFLPGSTPGGWMKYRLDEKESKALGADILLLCSKCHDRESKKRQRRDEGVMERRKGQKRKGDW